MSKGEDAFVKHDMARGEDAARLRIEAAIATVI